MQNYNFIQKILHDLVLSNKVINNSLFEIDKILYLKNEDIQKNLHVFITGLPRSGSTSILNFIYSTNEFGSLKYVNMPFVLAPNISKKIIKKNIFKKGDIIFWKGHVAMCINSKKLIHAYGPEKKVLIMPILQTIKRIDKTAKLKVKKISYIKY